jgi:hypothetical protein
MTERTLDILAAAVLTMQTPSAADVELAERIWSRLDEAGVVTTPREAFHRGVVAGACATFAHLIDDEQQLLNILRRTFERRQVPRE